MAPASSSRSVSWARPRRERLAVDERARAPRRPWLGEPEQRQRRAGEQGPAAVERGGRCGRGRSGSPRRLPPLDGGHEVVGERRSRAAALGGAGARSGSPSTPFGATARTPPARSAGMQLGERLGGAGLGVARGCTIDGARARSSDVSVRPAWASPSRPVAAAVGDHASTARPSRRAVRHRPCDRLGVAAVAVDEHDAGEGVGRAHQLDERRRSSASSPIDSVPANPACSPLAP